MGIGGAVGVDGRRRLGGESKTNRGVELVGFQSREAEVRQTCCWVLLLAGSRIRKGDCCCNWLWLWNLWCWCGGRDCGGVLRTAAPSGGAAAGAGAGDEGPG